ncbi:uncharacterized protein LOC121393785 isoform X1 [Xenopus laevis]|uniref:Uncharacterized protein LOC121393785 isoform X1 n=1 Tax=Xenopus laevis TaxID=8355 RepID=A0A8J1KPD0_XENLA|nr:uncharacterized protein LOC121393785 isoform X1 [Xenopus laevis]
MDVVSLYTIIPHTAGLAAIKHALLESTAYSGPPISFVLELLELSLTLNYFRFENNFYLQTSGTAMGAAMAPAYANLFMHQYEQCHIIPWFAENFFLFKRYIDDMLIIWRGSQDEFIEMVNELNALDSPVRFTYTIHPNTIQFLDIELRLHNNQLDFTLFRKPTDKNTLLHYDSCHPPSMKKSLPISQFCRVLRNNSDICAAECQLEEMWLRFKERGYPDRLLQEALSIARQRIADSVTTQICFIYLVLDFLTVT